MSKKRRLSETTRYFYRVAHGVSVLGLAAFLIFAAMAAAAVSGSADVTSERSRDIEDIRFSCILRDQSGEFAPVVIEILRRTDGGSRRDLARIHLFHSEDYQFVSFDAPLRFLHREGSRNSFLASGPTPFELNVDELTLKGKFRFIDDLDSESESYTVECLTGRSYAHEIIRGNVDAAVVERFHHRIHERNLRESIHSQMLEDLSALEVEYSEE